MCLLHQNHGSHSGHGRAVHGGEASRAGRFLGIGAVLLSLAVAGYYLWTEHRAHVVAFLPYSLLLLCPLLHVFMHGRHSGHATPVRHDELPAARRAARGES